MAFSQFFEDIVFWWFNALLSAPAFYPCPWIFFAVLSNGKNTGILICKIGKQLKTPEWHISFVRHAPIIIWFRKENVSRLNLSFAFAPEWHTVTDHLIVHSWLMSTKQETTACGLRVSYISQTPADVACKLRSLLLLTQAKASVIQKGRA